MRRTIDGAERAQSMNFDMDNPNDYEPPVLFAYADQVYKSGHYDTAMFWFYTAQLRARSDANKSLDKSVQEGVTRLSSVYSQTIGVYALEHPNELESTMKKVLEWDNGYLVVSALYNGIETEDYIDLIPILKNLCIDPEEFLKNIKEVTIRYE